MPNKMWGNMRKIWMWIRFGNIKEVPTDYINGIACEIEYRGRGNKVVGFWAYGSFDPSLPYQG